MNDIAMRYHKRPPFEPADQVKYFDFWRLYYTAFSRAQDLLVLTANETNREPSLYFREVYDNLVNYNSSQFDINAFEFSEVKDVNIKETYSFTSHISVYENCSLRDIAARRNGGNNRARTYDPLLVRQMLSQLSYASD